MTAKRVYSQPIYDSTLLFCGCKDIIAVLSIVKESFSQSKCLFVEKCSVLLDLLFVVLPCICTCMDIIGSMYST